MYIITYDTFFGDFGWATFVCLCRTIEEGEQIMRIHAEDIGDPLDTITWKREDEGLVFYNSHGFYVALYVQDYE